MEIFESARIASEALKQISGEERMQVLPTVLAQFEALIEICEQQSIFSNNETIEDLNEETIPYALSYFYYAGLISNYIIEKEKRLQAVNLAHENFSKFLDILIRHQIITEDESKLHSKQLPPERERDMRRQQLQLEHKAKLLADQAIHELETKGGKMELDTAYRALLVHSKFQTFREMKYLEEEIELLEFERQHPDEARLAAEQFRLQSGIGKPKLVTLTPQDVDRIVKNNRKIPLDTVELLRLEEEKERIQNKRPEVSQNIDFKNVDLEYGGGNPYTFQLKGEQEDHRDYEYRVVRTDTYQIGHPVEPEVDIHVEFQKEAEGKDYVQEENYDENDKREWDDWKADNPTGSGNKPRNV